MIALNFYLYPWCYGVRPLDVPENICLAGGGKLLVVNHSPKNKFSGDLFFGSPGPVLTEVNHLAKK